MYLIKQNSWNSLAKRNRISQRIVLDSKDRMSEVLMPMSTKKLTTKNLIVKIKELVRLKIWRDFDPNGP